MIAPKYLLHSDAERDLERVFQHYRREAGDRVAARFTVEMLRVLELVGSQPKLGTPWKGKLRTIRLNKFPYSIIYKEAAAGLLVLMLRHQHRRPLSG